MRIMTTSAHCTAFAVSITFNPASAAFLFEALSARRPTTTSTPESRRLLECAKPWLPYPMTATFFDLIHSALMSFS